MSAIAEGTPRAELPPVVTAVVVHAGCWAFLAAVASVLTEAQAAAFPWTLAQGALAAAIGCAARLPLWWFPINLAFFPALTAALQTAIPLGWHLAAFLGLFSLNAAAWRQRVPLFVSGARTARRVAMLLPRRWGMRALDVGCGTGSFLRALAATRPDVTCHGVELAPLSFLIGRWRAWRSSRAFAVRWGNFWNTDLSRYDLVYAYLSPQPMERLWLKARREMRPGALLVSNGFAIPGVEPTFTIATGERLNPALYVWRM